VRASQRAEFFRQGESDHEVANRQQQVFLVIEPLVRLIILALWTVAVLAGVVAVEALLALVTEIELAAKRLGAAVFDSVHRPEMRREIASAYKAGMQSGGKDEAERQMQEKLDEINPPDQQNL
jgi:hypothetical protein